MEPNRRDCAIAAEPSTPGAGAPDAAQPDRRMQLKAYNHWAVLLGRRRFPSVADLARGACGDIAPHSVLLDVSGESGSPAIAYLGERLGRECGAATSSLLRLSDAPDGSLLARLAGHYPAVLVNRAPTGFEAEFARLRDKTVLYRGILLPFSSDDCTIDFVLAVMNWKETAGTPPQDGMTEEPTALGWRASSPSPATLLPDWADGPGNDPGEAPSPLAAATGSVGQKPAPCEVAPLPASVTDRLEALPLQPLTALPPTGGEFALVLVRRPAGQPPALLGEVPHDPSLIEQAARRLAR